MKSSDGTLAVTRARVLGDTMPGEQLQVARKYMEADSMGTGCDPSLEGTVRV